LFGNEIPVAKEYLKALIVLPSSLVFNWYNEEESLRPHFREINMWDKIETFQKLEKYDLIFTSYAVAAEIFPF
jgi:non-specific serine/threonine protein kinase